MAKHNSNTPWRGDTSLSEMADIEKKNNLPADWTLENATIDVNKPKIPLVIHETYVWAQDNYNGNQWKHKLAIVFGILLSKVVPCVFFDKEEKNQVRDKMKTTSKTAERTAMIRGLPWIETGRKGSTKPRPYTTMASTYIMALMDSASPLQVHMHANDGCFPLQWSHKHGERRNNKDEKLKLTSRTNRKQTDQPSQHDSNGTGRCEEP
jgi:hypothetical protein